MTKVLESQFFETEVLPCLTQQIKADRNCSYSFMLYQGVDSQVEQQKNNLFELEDIIITGSRRYRWL